MIQALILAGGLGTRLQTIVDDRPKPMAKIDHKNGATKPFLEIQLDFLRSYEVRRFIFCVGYLHQQIQDYFGDGSRWGVQIDYSVEESLLGTGGAIKQAEKYIAGPFLALNGDSFFDLNLNDLLAFHAAQKAATPPGRYLGTIALAQVDDASDYGTVQLDQTGRITNFAEKVSAATDRPLQPGSPQWINAGIYVLEPDLLKTIPPSQKTSIEREIFPSSLNHGYWLGGYRTEGFFVDIGTPAGYGKFLSYIKEEW